MAVRPVPRALISVTAVLAVLAAYTAVPTAASADPADIPAANGLRAALSDPHGLADFVDGLSGVGAFAAPAPGLTVVPGAKDVLELQNLVAKAVDQVSGYAAADSPSALAAALAATDTDISTDSNLGGAPYTKRHVTWTAHSSKDGTVDRLALTLTVTRNVPAGIRVSTQTKPFDFTSAGGLQAMLTLTLHANVDYDGSTSTSWVEADPAVTNLSVGTHATPKDLGTADAAIGILRVGLDPAASSYDDVVHISTAVRDPNNDNRLTVGSAGELGASGAPAGLTTVALAKPGGGTLSGDLKIASKNGDTITGLPSISTAVHVATTDWSSGDPSASYPDGDLDPVAAFERLTPFDLAQGVAQLAATVREIQGARPTNSTIEVDLPFLHGTVSDLVPASEALDQFLTNHVKPGINGMPGVPDFASVQQMFDELEQTTGPGTAKIYTVAVSFASFQGAGTEFPRLPFTLHVHRAASSQSADPLADVLTGGADSVTYADTTITDTATNWKGVNDEFVDSLRGRQVTAGQSTAQIDHITLSSDRTQATITLTGASLGVTSGSFWKGGTPSNSNGTRPAYVISGGDPKTGNVELGDLLKGAGRLRAANAVRPQATITPAYDLDVPLVLDLQAPATGTECQTRFNTAEACPFTEATGADGSGPKRVVAELPVRSDRVELTVGGAGTPLLASTSVMSTPVDLVAPVGYVPVQVGGSITICPTSGYDASCTKTGSPGPLVTINTTTSDGQPATLPLGEVFATARDEPDSIVTGTESARAHGHLLFDVLNDPGFFGASSGSADIDASVTPSPTPTVAGTDLAKLKVLDVKPGQDNALFGVLLADLRALDTQLHTPVTANGFDTTIPLLGTSLGTLMAGTERRANPQTTYTAIHKNPSDPSSPVTFLKLTDGTASFGAGDIGRPVTVGSDQLVITSLVPNDATSVLLVAPPATIPATGTPYLLGDGLQQSVAVFTAAPPEDLNELLTALESRLGNSSSVTFAVDPATKVMTLTVDWKRSYTTQSQLAMHLSKLNADLAGTPSGGVLPISFVGEDKAVLKVPLDAASIDSPAASLTIDAAISSRRGEVKASQDNAGYSASVGAFGITIGDSPDPKNTSVHADIAATGKHTGGAEPLSSWGAGLAPTDVGQGATAVTCTGVSSTTALGFCAALPLHWSGGTDTLKIRLPLTDSAYAAALDASTQLDGTDRTSDLPSLAAALAAARFNPLPLGNGLLSFIDNAKQGLNVATAGGKVPLIGKDLQAGQDFLGALRTGLATAFGSVNTSPATFGEVKTAISGAISTAGGTLLQGSPTITGQCKVPISPPSAVVATPHDPNDQDEVRVTYQYAVVGQVDGGVETQKALSNVVTNRTKLGTDPNTNTTATNTITWSAAQPPAHVPTYKVWRKVGTGSWVFVQEVGGTSLTDGGQGGSPSAADVGDPAGATYTGPCADSDPSQYVQNVTVGASFGKGVISANDGCAKANDADPDNKKCYQLNLPLDFGLPGLSLRALKDANGVHQDITARLGWGLGIKVTLDKNKGVLLETAGSPTRLQVGAAIGIPGLIDADLSFLHASLTNKTPDTPVMHALFEVDLKCPGSCSNGQVSLTQLAGNVTKALDPKVSGAFDIDEAVKTDVDPSLPGLSAQFKFAAGWAAGGGAPLSFTISKLEFDSVTIDPGTFLASTVYPMVRDIANTLKPVEPILDTITAPIPVLSDLSHLAGGGDVTIVSLAQAFGSADGVQDVIDTVKSITKLADALAGGGSGGGIALGSFAIVQAKAISTAATPDVADSFIGPITGAANVAAGGDPGSILGTLSDDMTDKSASLQSSPGFTFPALTSPRQLLGLFVGGDATLATADSGTLSIGFEMSEAFGPVYAPPPVLVVISGGASVSLHVKAGFDTFGIRQAVEDGQPAQILNSLFFFTTDDSGAPLPVVTFHGELAAGAEVSVAFLSAGVEGGISLTVVFTWADPDNDGKFRFNEFLAAAVQNPICLFNVGGQLSLFINVFITIGFSPFDVSFDFTLVNIKLLDFSIKPNCTPPPPKLGGVTSGNVLYLFAGRLGNGPRGDGLWYANNTTDETWVVHQEDDESYAVKALGYQQVFPATVQSIVLDAKDYDGKLSVLFQGGQKDVNGQEVDVPFGAKVYVIGGKKDDAIKTADSLTKVDGGGGQDNISAGDRPHPELAMVNAGKSVLVAGNSGDDHITVGNETDSVAGDGRLKWTDITSGFDVTSYGVDHTKDAKPLPFNPDEATTVHISTAVLDPSTVGWDSFTTPSSGSGGSDVIQVGFGGDTVYGGDGDDRISVSQDSPLLGATEGVGKDAQLSDPGTTIYGNEGSDAINGGTGPDTIYTGGSLPTTTDATEDNPGSHDDQGAAGHNTVDTGTGNDTVYGSSAVDLVIGHSLPAANGKPAQHDTIYGLGGNDVLVGGEGGDKVYAGRGDDLIAAQPSKVDLATTVPDQLPQPTWATAYAVTPLPDSNPALDKTLVGGGGIDRVYGGDGNSHIWGDHSKSKDGNDDPCLSPGPDQSDPPVEKPRDADNESDPANLDAADLIRGGNGDDTVQAGGGGDWVFAANGVNHVCGEGGDDHLYGGDTVDTVWGGSGGDVVQGNAADDKLYGNDGPDFIYGNLGTDLIEGNGDKDTLFGGENPDTVVGGTTTAKRPDDDDVIYGDIGTDTLIGDNGDPTNATDGPAYDLDNLSASYGGEDTLYGGADEDTGYGGIEGDTIYGGAKNDHLEGNNDIDTIYGEDGADDIIGGSSQLPGHNPAAKDAVGYPDAGDVIDGGIGDDVVTGDNATIQDTLTVDTADSVMKGRSPALTVGRHVTPYDLGYAPTAGNAGGDTITGGAASDIVYGQAGIDTVHGNAGEDYLEGGPDGDTLFGDAGQDDIVGGSLYAETGTGQSTTGQLDNGDRISGGDNADVVLGDNGLVTRDPAISPSDITKGRSDADALPAVPMLLRSIQRYDLGDTPIAKTSGGDLVNGDNGSDVILGQGGNDLIEGDNDADYAEGGPGRDWVEGNTGDDDLVGGSSTIFGNDAGNTTQGQPDVGDVVYGGPGDDLVTGDNSVLNRVGTPSPYLFRVGSTGTIETQRSLRLLDLSWSNGYLGGPTRAVAGGDQLSGGGGVDVVFGQDGEDQISGGGSDDYAEGNGGHDTVYGDRTLADAGVTITHPVPDWLGPATDSIGDTATPNGQDDLIGGSSVQAFRDIEDDIHGDAASDYEIGDNGTEIRDILDATGKAVIPTTDLSAVVLPLTDRIYAGRYDPAHIPADAAYVRHGTSASSPTRFCTTSQATCEPTGAAGDDTLWGDEGTDFMYGQDGKDSMYGETGSTAGANDGGVDDGTQLDDDDMYGELGNDVMFGEAGQDAMVGDRGGVVDKYQDGSNDFVLDYNQVPQIHYEGFVKGSVSRVTDLLHDVNGDASIGSGNTAPMPHRGDLEGGNDRMRGGVGDDSMHGGFGDDLANGDSEGDVVFGDDGADVLWGGKGCDAAVDTSTVSPDCYTGGVFDPNARGTKDQMVDYINGGKGATSGPSVDPKTGDLGSDVLDWRPRGTYGAPGSTTCTANPWPQTFANGKTVTTIDPCSWFEITSLDDADVANNQHHQGIDWMYGGWDRDVMQADVADNGPNLGDRLIDWSGAYNLYTHCNAAYGGFNDLRQWSPDMQSFLQQWAYSLGAGQLNDVTTTGTSAYDELALVYQADLSMHGSGSDFPSTPGHFDNPNACAP